MNAMTGDFVAADQLGVVLPGAARTRLGQAGASPVSMKWSALQDAADVVAMLAGIQTETRRPEVRDFPAVIEDAGGWRRDHAERGVDDLAAIMEHGLAALLAVNARGANPAPAALALWREYEAARAAIMALAPPPSATSPHSPT